MKIKDSDIPLPYLRKSAKIDKAISDKYPQGYFKKKKCRYCGKIFQPVAPSHHYCSEECTVNASADSYIHRNYGISLEDYKDLYIRQEGKCAICGSKGFTLKKSQKVPLVIDHNHKTGEVRGLLCPNCNRALGLLKDDEFSIKNTIKYLQQKPIKSKESKNNRLKRIRAKSNSPLSKRTVFAIYKDIFENKLRTNDICTKYNFTKETKRNIELGKCYQKYLQEYRKSATTIQ